MSAEMERAPGRPGTVLYSPVPQALAIVRPLVVPLSLMLLALFLRTYRFETVGWVPDTYERLFDARLIASGQLPDSSLYPPGFAVVLAPFFAVLPDTLATMQMVIIGAGVALVAVGYAWMLRLTGDRFAASMVAFAAATCPALVYSSRDAFFDIINVLLIVSLFFLLPMLRNRGLLAFGAYGVLLAVLVNIRVTNVFLLPALMLVWMDANHASLNRRELVRVLLSPPVLTTGFTLAGLCALSILAGAWFEGAQSAPLTMDEFADNVAYYYLTSSYGFFGLVFLLPLAFVGLAHLWHSKRLYSYALVYVIVIWPLAHAPFDFSNFRYTLPVLFLILSLIAIGASSLLQRLKTWKKPSAWRIALVYWFLLTIALLFSFGSGQVLAEWPRRVAQSDEGLAREFRPAVLNMEEGSLVVTAVARAFRDTPAPVDYLDLVDHHIEWGTDDASLSRLTATIDARIAAGNHVYYLYSHWEGGHDFLGTDGKEKYRRFFEAIDSEFKLTQLQRSTDERVGLYPWILYAVELDK